MNMRNSQRQLNNKGFTLMELIVVLAIIVVMAGAAAVTVSMLDSSYVEDAERGIKDYIALGRTKSMSVSAKDWYVVVTKKNGDYYACLYKVTQEIEEIEGVKKPKTTTSLIEEKELGTNISMYFTDGNSINDKLIDDTNELYMYFDPSTGKINNVVYGTTSADIGSGIGYISIKRNDYVISLKVFYNTCKCERE